MGLTVTQLAFAFGGSNPSLPTIRKGSITELFFLSFFHKKSPSFVIKEGLLNKPNYFNLKVLLSAAMDACAGVDLREQ